MQAAATTPLKPGQRVTGAARDQVTADVVRRYNKGQPIRGIAADLGRSYGFVHIILTEASVTMRRRGGSRPGQRRHS